MAERVVAQLFILQHHFAHGGTMVKNMSFNEAVRASN